jgi:hypothetical protein
MRMGMGRAASNAVLAIVLVIACSGEGGGKGGLGIDDGAKLGESTSMLVTRTSGATMTLKTGASVNVPPGALKSDALLEMKRPPDTRALELTRAVPKRYRLASAPYVLTPHGSMFDQNVNISLPIGRSVKSDKLRVARIENEEDTNWTVMATPNVAGRAATFGVQRFSVLVLVEEVDEGDTTHGDPKARLLAKLKQCNMIEKNGDFTDGFFDDNLETKSAKCEIDCVLGASCEDFVGYGIFCEEDIAAEERLESCYEQCVGYETDVECSGDAGSPIDAYACDGTADCPDGRDEASCPDDAFFVCGDGQRVSEDDHCNGWVECENGADEANCPAGTSFTCANGDKQPRDTECDGYEECGDGSDERNCGDRVFTCADGSEKISKDRVCDADPDCADGSDEPARCLKVSCPQAASGTRPPTGSDGDGATRASHGPRASRWYGLTARHPSRR